MWLWWLRVTATARALQAQWFPNNRRDCEQLVEVYRGQAMRSCALICTSSKTSQRVGTCVLKTEQNLQTIHVMESLSPRIILAPQVTNTWLPAGCISTSAQVLPMLCGAFAQCLEAGSNCFKLHVARLWCRPLEPNQYISRGQFKLGLSRAWSTFLKLTKFTSDQHLNGARTQVFCRGLHEHSESKWEEETGFLYIYFKSKLTGV